MKSIAVQRAAELVEGQAVEIGQVVNLVAAKNSFPLYKSVE